MGEYPPYPQDDRIILKPEIPEDKVLVWKKSLDRRRIGYSAESMSHPAKMDLSLIQYIIKNLTEPREIILDPMSGVGSTLLEAARLGRNAIGVEYESKFVDWTNKNLETLEKQEIIGSKGSARVICGDARELTTLLSKHVDGIVMSPPFSQANKGGGIAKKGYNGKHGKDEKLPQRHERQLTEDKDNISNLPHGNIDFILMSPPYSAGIGHSQGKKAGRDKIGKERFYGYYGAGDKDNIGNIREHGEIDAIVTSPPHGNRLSDDRVDDGDKDRMSYRQTIKGKREKQICVEKGIDPSTYSKDKENLGNLKGKSYLSEMFKVYEQCYSVLKQGGKAILVTKNFTRNWKQVRLDYDTIILMEKIGFRLVDRYFREISKPSFWILNYRKRCMAKGVPDPTAHYEDVLVFIKEDDGENKDRR